MACTRRRAWAWQQGQCAWTVNNNHRPPLQGHRCARLPSRPSAALARRCCRLATGRVARQHSCKQVWARALACSRSRHCRPGWRRARTPPPPRAGGTPAGPDVSFGKWVTKPEAGRSPSGKSKGACRGVLWGWGCSALLPLRVDSRTGPAHGRQANRARGPGGLLLRSLMYWLAAGSLQAPPPAAQMPALGPGPTSHRAAGPRCPSQGGRATRPLCAPSHALGALMGMAGPRCPPHLVSTVTHIGCLPSAQPLMNAQGGGAAACTWLPDQCSLATDPLRPWRG